MKRITLFTAILVTMIMVTISSCGSKRNPGRIYMPDMAYSRAYETYALRDSNIFTSDPADLGHKIFYNNQPVNGTIQRGELFPYTLPNDSIGYKMSAQVLNPLGPWTKADSLEAGRLYNINCAICHGATGVANGPLSAKIGAIANLTLPLYVSMADGTMFHSITYGKNNMGSYASQLDRKQRWMVIKYIRSLQPKAGAATTAASANAVTDSAAAKKTK